MATLDQIESVLLHQFQQAERSELTPSQAASSAARMMLSMFPELREPKAPATRVDRTGMDSLPITTAITGNACATTEAK